MKSYAKMVNEQIKDVRSLIITDYRDRFCGLVDAVSFSNMVEEYILAPQGIVKLDYDDISALLRDNMEIDTIVVEVGQKVKRLQWEKAIGKMEKAHPGREMNELLFQWLIPEGITMEEIDFADGANVIPEGLKIKWGLSLAKADNPRLNWFLVARFK